MGSAPCSSSPQAATDNSVALEKPARLTIDQSSLVLVSDCQIKSYKANRETVTLSRGSAHVRKFPHFVWKVSLKQIQSKYPTVLHPSLMSFSLTQIKCSLQRNFSIVGNKGCCFSPHIFPIVFDKKNVFYIEESFSRHACMARGFLLIGRKALLRFSFSWKTIFSPA